MWVVILDVILSHPLSSPTKPSRNPQQDTLFQRTQTSLRQTLSQYANLRRDRSSVPDMELQGLLRDELEVLKFTIDKLDRGVIRIAAFGLVSRGKSA
ncbi:MAG TPA: GTPase, partial [Cyanobacteria bacterium UBA11148]|nr:GTPase [Cyanobacteria bacterium UBA11148]